MYSDPDRASRSVAALATEQLGPFDGDLVAGIPAAPGDPLFSPAHIIPPFALACIIGSEPPGPCGKDIYRALGQTANYQVTAAPLYQALDDLRGRGILAQEERVHTKHHRVVDPVQADDFLEAYEARLRWWLRLCRTARDELAEPCDVAD